MTEKFHDYILGSRVTVVTDNNPLCHVLKNAKLDAVSHRWLSSLSLYDFDLVYKQGSTHTDADGLSRRPQDPPEADEEYRDTLEKAGFLLEKARRFQDDNPQVVNRSAVVSILTAKSAGRPVHSTQQTARHTTPMSHDNDVTDNFTPAVEAVVRDPNTIPDGILEAEGGEPDFTTLTVDDWRRLQQQDPHIAAVCQALKEGTDLTNQQNFYPPPPHKTDIAGFSDLQDILVPMERVKQCMAHCTKHCLNCFT
ncbi:hypothetical protein C0Q70_15868 [Pomacea canaliculata]|uniref:Uncharacterized protein n=1 Tax=Pomacea canaliculata TaxID=400727 RepID=A0A2T7NW02_POMCA|nr:hypothetical protein C0Q70_15868 [Pomacea canaliculata]